MILFKKRFKVMISFCMFFMLIFCCNFIVARANELPQSKLVGVDHLPIIEGDSETFYLRTIFDKESEKCDVQYRIFLNKINTNKWDELTKGYTNPVNADKIYKFCSDKKFTQGEYKLSVWVKRYGKQCKNNKYDTYSITTLKCLNKQNELKLNKELGMEQETFIIGQNITINNIKGLDNKYLYKLNYYNVSRNVWKRNFTGYSKKVSWAPVSAGDYILEILVKSPNSKKQYDGKKLKLITVKEKPTDDSLIAYKDSYIYYGNAEDNYKLYKKNINGTKQEKLCDDSISGVNIKGEWIYYVNAFNDKVYKITNDGKRKQEVFSESEKDICKQNSLIDFKIPNDFGNEDIIIKNCFDESLSIELENIFYDRKTHKIITSTVSPMRLKPGSSSTKKELYFDSMWSDKYLYLGSSLKNIKVCSNYDFSETKIDNPNYSYFKNLISSKEFINQKIYEENRRKYREEEQRKKELREAEEKRKKELKENNYIPIKTGIYFFKPNERYIGETTVIVADSIGDPVANITVVNLSDKEIDAFKISFKCYDAFDKPVNKFLDNSNTFYGVAQNISLKSAEFDEYMWSLSLYDLTTKIKDIKVLEVHFTDGTTWKSK
ncbi:DUF5050 domain-containing protein [Clostridium ganghwense]|uniref:DUF5050 domain-containing protein n=1 Tax=Clostridium ganghwense TaxID=312089 RepID=A0ABT4CTS7_9CLOT|nr:DUF5050 domain-containing protein [Clostridium ganghwense]MCY6372484.1 DUF5050 domain-containing protein [Clostridium ganghwense]